MNSSMSILSDMKKFKFAQTMIFAINEMNKDPSILPNVTLGWRIYDDCGTMDILRAGLALVSGLSGSKIQYTCGEFILYYNVEVCAIFLLTILLFQISHFATCACLTNRNLYPTFYRTIPSDYYQSRAVAQLIKHFGWTWIGVIAVNNYYGLNGVASFARVAREYEICIEYSKAFSSSDPPEHLQRIVDVIRHATSRVILAFMSHREIKMLAAELYRQNITGLQWVGSDAWITDYSLTDSEGHSILIGSLGFVVAKTHIPGLEDHLRRLHLSQFPDSQFVKDFWEAVFDCSLVHSTNADRKPCTGTESLQNVEIDFTDVSELRFVSNVYNSLYAVAHALDDLFKCQEGMGPFQNGSCADTKNIQPSQVNIHNGDLPARYELVNLQTTDKGLEAVTVGVYDASFPEIKQLSVFLFIFIGGSFSVCSKSCLPGTHKVLTKGRPICCYDCIRCPAGEITNTTDACVPKVVEFLAYTELLGYLLVLFALMGWFLTILFTLIYYCHKETPLVRANNSELSFLLLFCLSLCFLCSLTFIGRPSEWSCMLRHTAFGITFVLCISCVLGKTIVVLMAFRATLPGSNVMKWFGPFQQKLSVFGAALIQVIICILWLTINPPFPHYNMLYYKDRIILECNLGSPIGFWAVLGYIGLLAVLCFVLAFLARKLPDNFNEAKFITFSMLIFCAVWITFIPAYVSSPGKFTVAVEIFAILASSYGLLFCIFMPKVFIILFHPEKNTKKHIMGKTQNDIRY
uniref:G-protein coupled receptors family 3 profile domain-containing protein n=1 Tax=Neogobius melanostomus TaxID=47308 RepID=A0A8C6S550_9GOBI